MKENKLEKTLENFLHDIASTDNIIKALEIIIPSISTCNPQVGLSLSTFLSSIHIGVNITSRRKAEKRLIQIIEAINKIIKNQQNGETNFEALLICPELFRNALIYDDEDRVIEHLILIEALFSSGKMDFDNLAGALRLVSQLSCMEYRILKLVPHVDTKWKDILRINELSSLQVTNEEQLTAAFLSLINMNLVVRKLSIKHDGGPELGTLNYNDNLEYIRLSAYGKVFIETLEGIKPKE